MPTKVGKITGWGRRGPEFVEAFLETGQSGSQVRIGSLSEYQKPCRFPRWAAFRRAP